MILLSSFFNILNIVVAIFVILSVIAFFSQGNKEKKIKVKRKDVKIEYLNTAPPTHSDTFVTYVGGARNYSGFEHLGTFVGFVIYSVEDEAPIIYRQDMKMLGHIPRERIKEYTAWCKCNTYPCVGYILKSTDPEHLNTQVKIIRPYNEDYVNSEIEQFLNIVNLKYGDVNGSKVKV